MVIFHRFLYVYHGISDVFPLKKIRQPEARGSSIAAEVLHQLKSFLRRFLEKRQISYRNPLEIL